MLNEMKEAFKQIMESTPIKEMGAELGRLGVQGQAEVANALFNGNSYLPYGVGQRPVEEVTQEQAPVKEQQIESQGRDM